MVTPFGTSPLAGIAYFSAFFARDGCTLKQKLAPRSQLPSRLYSSPPRTGESMPTRYEGPLPAPLVHAHCLAAQVTQADCVSHGSDRCVPIDYFQFPSVPTPRVPYIITDIRPNVFVPIFLGLFQPWNCYSSAP